jgi:hypothetical protein
VRSHIRNMSRFAMLFLGWVSHSLPSKIVRARDNSEDRAETDKNIDGAESAKHIVLLLTRSGDMGLLVMRYKNLVECRLLISRDRCWGM